MRFPSSVKIGAMRFAVRRAPHLAELGKEAITSARTQEVLVQPGQAPSYERDTILHEILHAVIAETGLRAWFSDQDKEEEMVLVLAPALLEVLRENPALVRYLCEK